jgi:hypothetical protein
MSDCEILKVALPQKPLSHTTLHIDLTSDSPDSLSTHASMPPMRPPPPKPTPTDPCNVKYRAVWGDVGLDAHIIPHDIQSDPEQQQPVAAQEEVEDPPGPSGDSPTVKKIKLKRTGCCWGRATLVPRPVPAERTITYVQLFFHYFPMEEWPGCTVVLRRLKDLKGRIYHMFDFEVPSGDFYLPHFVVAYDKKQQQASVLMGLELGPNDRGFTKGLLQKFFKMFMGGFLYPYWTQKHTDVFNTPSLDWSIDPIEAATEMKDEIAGWARAPARKAFEHPLWIAFQELDDFDD